MFDKNRPELLKIDIKINEDTIVSDVDNEVDVEKSIDKYLDMLSNKVLTWVTRNTGFKEVEVSVTLTDTYTQAGTILYDENENILDDEDYLDEIVDVIDEHIKEDLFNSNEWVVYKRGVE
jgi:hypothetical protein